VVSGVGGQYTSGLGGSCPFAALLPLAPALSVAGFFFFFLSVSSAANKLPVPIFASSAAPARLLPPPAILYVFATARERKKIRSCPRHSYRLAPRDLRRGGGGGARWEREAAMWARVFAGSIGAAGIGFAELASVSSRRAAVCVSRRVGWLNRRKKTDGCSGWAQLRTRRRATWSERRAWMRPHCLYFLQLRNSECIQL
jgi:hypothetical protein